MADELKSLRQIFDGRLFRVPDYQRGYAWQSSKDGYQKSQLGEFWDDLDNIDKKDHYTGQLTLNKLTGDEANKILDDGSKNPNAEVCEVVDGQQRLTTAVILIRVLLERFGYKFEDKKKSAELEEKAAKFEAELGEELRDIEKRFLRYKKPGAKEFSYVFGYAKDDPSFNWLRYKFFGKEDAPHGAIAKTYYTENLKAAKKFFTDRVKKLSDDAAVTIYKKLVNRLKFNLREISDSFDVFVSFETMNNRGKPLSNLELLKNRLIYLSVIFKDKNLRGEIAQAWKEIYKRLGQNPDQLLDDDDFLRAHWLMRHGAPNRRQREDITDLMKLFSPKNIKGYRTTDDSTTNETNKKKKKEFITSDTVREYVRSLSKFAKYYCFLNFPNTVDPENNLTADEKIWLLLLNQLGFRYFTPLLMVACSKNPAPERLELFKAIERFIFVNFVLCPYRSDKDKSIYCDLARDLNRGKDKNGNTVTIADITQRLDENVESELGGAYNSFANKIAENFRRGKGYSDWDTPLRYVLFAREYDLRLKNKRTDQLAFDSLKNFAESYGTIEHIFPQTPSEDWQKIFAAYNADEQKILQNALGNLLRLPKPDNSALSNRGFEYKKEHDYCNGSQSEIEVAKNSQWTAAEILARSKELMKFISTRWQLNFTDEQIKNLLHLDFVK